MLALVVLWSVICIVYFSAIGTWYLSFLPILVGLVLVMYVHDATGGKIERSEQVKGFFLRHAFSFAWICVMLGLWGMADIFGVELRYMSMLLVGINIVGWIGSYFLAYEDGKDIFQIGYWIASCIMLGSMWTQVETLRAFADIVIAYVSMTMAIYAFIVFVGGALDKKIGRELTYPLFVLVLLCAMFLVYHYTNTDIVLSLVGSQALLMGLYCVIFGIYRWHEKYADRPIASSTHVLKNILAGKNLLHQQHIAPFRQETIEHAYSFLSRLDDRTKFTISLLNIALILGQVWYFLEHMGSGGVWREEILLWFGIVLFFVNYLLLRQIGFYHLMQRVVAFVLINFGVYLTIINIFGVDPVYIVGIGTIWSVVNSLLIFNTGGLRARGYLASRDYLYRIGANGLVTVCNVYFMFLLPLSLQMRFFLALLYFGVQLFLTLYNLRYADEFGYEEIGA